MKFFVAICFLVAAAEAQTCQITVPISVMTSGKAVTGLAAGAIAIKRPSGATALGLNPAPPQHIELLIDGSGSMGGTQWRTSAAVADALLAAIPAPTQVRLAAFEDKIAPMAPFRAPAAGYRQALAAAYAGFHPHGGTAFYDALSLSVAPPTAFEPGDAIIALSDGSDDSSRITADVALAALQGSRIRLILLRIGDNPRPDKIAQQSGGASIAVGADPAAAAHAAWQLLSAQYLLTVALHGHDNHLQLVLPPPLAGATAFAPATLPAC